MPPKASRPGTAPSKDPQAKANAEAAAARRFPANWPLPSVARPYTHPSPEHGAVLLLGLQPPGILGKDSVLDFDLPDWPPCAFTRAAPRRA